MAVRCLLGGWGPGGEGPRPLEPAGGACVVLPTWIIDLASPSVMLAPSLWYLVRSPGRCTQCCW